MIKYLFFDVYQTFLDVDVEQKNFDRAWRVFEDYLINRQVPKSLAAKFRNFFDRQELEFYRTRNKKIHHHDWIENIYAIFKKQYNITISSNEAQLLMRAFRKESCAFCRPYPQVKETLERLSKRFILSTASLAHRSITEVELEEAGIAKYFSHLIFTSDIGYRKPSKEFYRQILQIVGAKSSQSVMIGDNLIDDIYGAKQIGMWTIWIRNPLTMDKIADVIPDHIVDIKNFQEIEKKIELINNSLSS
jgi:putative hydrolase of the HAD superfamily